ncbi:MAG: hypothetical protein BMS9Abin25_0719 [Gammaproteobacteria bacterium]|nr:MAG: hypothetical protein BMS9Abin25_0719 [Gammaproteobacteria bacterium]
MKLRILQSLFLVSVIINFTACSEVDDSTDKNKLLATIGVIATSDFIPDRTNNLKSQELGLPDVLADRIIEYLSKSKRFSVVERAALRRVVLEKRFGKDLTNTYLDRTLDKAIDAMEVVEGSIVGTTGSLADYNDIVKDFQDLGSAVGADYIVLGKLEKLNRATEETAIPYSSDGRTVRRNTTDARLRLRMIDVKSGTVLGAVSLRTKVSESLFDGKLSDTDEFTFYDHLGQIAASKVLNTVFPAQIVSVKPLVISRGLNDGTKEGDVYIVKREGKEIKDRSGIVIARLKSDVGRVEVVTPQETVSIVKSVAGNDFNQGDLAYLEVESSGLPTTVATAAKVPLSGRTSGQLGSSKLPRLAVGMVKSGSTDAKGNEAEKNTPIFTDTIISRLTQTKRFQLIDRQEVDQLLTEQLAQALAENRDMPSAMGTLKGADYIVYGSLASFSVEEKTTQLPGSSRSFTSKVGHVEGNMRIVDARSGDIMASRKISVVEKIDDTTKGSRQVTALADAYAEQVVMLLMNSVYPIKVAAVGDDGTIYINRGADGGLNLDEVLDVFRPGKPIIDPDTGIQLGVEEKVIGQLKVTEVEDARSKGITTMEGVAIATGDILKRSPNRDVAQKNLTSLSSRTGGILPGGMQKDRASGGKKYTLAFGRLKINPSARTNGFDQGYAKRMRDDLIIKLTNTNRFVVMERGEVDQVLDEKAFEAIVTGGDIKNRLGELVGADYIIYGEVSNFYTQTNKKKVAYLDEETVSTNGVAEGMFRVIDVHSGAVIGADKVRYSMKVSHADDITQVMSDLLNSFTTKSVAAIVARLFPVRVLGSAGDGTFYLNRGADVGMERGTTFDVMRPGKELKDPDTGISFGSAETKVAVMEIISVEPSRARAKLVSGENAQTGDILRKSQAIEKQVKPKVKKPAW